MIVLVQHHVTDYEKWRPVFDEHDAVRRRHGSTGYLVYRGLDDPNDITILTQWPSMAEANAFLNDPSLREAMAMGGVIGEPTVRLLSEAGASDYSAQKAA
jgi:quinol monooxygenase YgiN